MRKRSIHKYQKAVPVFLLCLFCLGGVLRAEDERFSQRFPSSPAMGNAYPGMAPQAPASSSGSSADIKVEKMPSGKYYFDFKAATLINVLNVLSRLSGINFVAGREVADRQVNMTLDNVSLEDVLQAVSSGCNVSYDPLPGRNIYLFRASSDSPEKPPLMTRVFKLYYVRVNKIREIEASTSSSSSSSGSTGGGGLQTFKTNNENQNLEDAAIFKAIQKILSERGKVSIDDRSNSLIVTDTEDRLKMIESAIVQLDRPLDQVLINVLLVETFEDLDRALGVRWGDDNGVFGTVYGRAEDTTFPFMTEAGSRNNVSDWFTMLRTQFDPAANTNPGLGPNASTATSGVRDFSSFQIRVTAMESASKLRILAKPKILVLDNHPAIVKIATNAAIGTTTVTEAGGAGSSSESIERSEVGTILRVTPLINTGDRITMTVEPTFATVDDSSISVSATAATGDPTTRTARTTLMVNDGQTIAMGGLLLSTQSNGNRKVPFFGNIPVIGKAFFTENGKAIQDRELVLFVTPFIIRDPSMLETPQTPDRRRRFDDEVAPFWKVKQKQWYKDLKDGPVEETDYDGYFNVRKKLIDTTLGTLDQKPAS